MAGREPNFEEIYAFAVQLAKDAGAMILEGSSKRTASAADSGLETKKNSVDLVTETGQAVEAFIKSRIASAYPSFKFPTFIADPLYGTTNFVHVIDFVCCSIGFTYKQVPVIGCRHLQPLLSLSKLYSARTGDGAWLNETTRLPLTHPSPPPLPSLGDAVIGVEWGSDRSKAVIEKKGRTFMKLARDGKDRGRGDDAFAEEYSVRTCVLLLISSAALNYSFVAAGQLDLYWEIGYWSWDVCAGTIIAREAGGKVYGNSGAPLQPQDLMGHHFFVVRAIGDTLDAEGKVVETGEQAQDRIAKAFF
ncbi:hypothetical protein JCM10213_004156 [Rhodosporidiobolus nylandii]